MLLQEQFVHTGRWLFRWRSYLPLIFFALLLIQLRQFQYLGGTEATDLVWEVVCLAVSLSGLGVRILAVGYAPRGTSGRNTRKQVAESLNTSGAYSVVRHPLYVGNFFMWFGVVLFEHNWWLALVFVLCFALYYERIMCAEEQFLKERFGETYLQWAQRTPAFFPKFRRWQRPRLAFSWQTVLRREYPGLFALITAFTVLEVLGDVVVTGSAELDPMWMGLFGVTGVTYLVLRWLKRRTHLLRVSGR
jgi:protein-S-isoprenylcysteine O-methyltransferase Ste14